MNICGSILQQRISLCEEDAENFFVWGGCICGFLALLAVAEANMVAFYLTALFDETSEYLKNVI